MKKSLAMKFAIIVWFAAASALNSLQAFQSDNHSAMPPALQDKVTVAILHPSQGSIKALATLREKGLISIPQLFVLGIYHEKELTDYTKAMEYVKTNNLDWFVFHPISTPLSPEILFQKNACTPEFEEIFEQTDGIIFFGGPDIPPLLYGEKTDLLTKIEDPYRHFLELSFVFHLLGGLQDEAFPAFLERRPGYPILGICLGCQTLNAGTGGTLVQDIWSEVYGKTSLEDVIELGREYWHWSPFFKLAPQEKWTGYALHSINLDGQGKFCTAMGLRPKDTPLILSSHHQAVDNLGKAFRPIAHSPDGKVIEAIEHITYPNVLGVQFHPEDPDLYDSEALVRLSPQDPEPVNLPVFLKKHPPSIAFHKKLWAWVSRQWVEFHKART